jgi:hypothetical protein
LKEAELLHAAVVGAVVEGLVPGVTLELGKDGRIAGGERVGACLLIEGESQFFDTTDVPCSKGDATEDVFLLGSLRVEFGAVAGDELFIELLIFRGDDGKGSREAFLEGVAAGHGFTRGGLGTGRFLRIFAVDFRAGFVKKRAEHGRTSWSYWRRMSFTLSGSRITRS